MQKTIYTCDNCEQAIGTKKHISVSFGNHSGVANPPGELSSGWIVQPSLHGKFLHFCNGNCIGRYFAKLLKTGELPVFTGKKIK
jgi:hypothetical protein